MPTPTQWWRADLLALLDGLDYRSDQALMKMRRLLASSPACIPLAQKVCALFGDDIVLTTFEGLDECSIVTYEKSTALMGLDCESTVRIVVGLNSSRISEGLAHELLHADLMIAGFPRLRGRINEDDGYFYYGAF